MDKQHPPTATVSSQPATLELDEDLSFQHRQWRVQIVSWWLMAALVMLAALGLFGSGPLSAAKVKADGIALEFERFVRVGDENELRFVLEPSPAKATVLRLAQRFLESVAIERIQPQPDTVRPEQNWTAFVFEGAGRSRSHPFVVRFTLSPQRVGQMSGQVRFQDGETVGFGQFAFP